MALFHYKQCSVWLGGNDKLRPVFQDNLKFAVLVVSVYIGYREFIGLIQYFKQPVFEFFVRHFLSPLNEVD